MEMTRNVTVTATATLTCLALCLPAVAGATPLTAGPPAALPAPAAWVRTLQTELTTLHFFGGPITGVYGPLTTAAVKQFQTTVGLVPDGKWGPKSQAALQQRLAHRG